MGDVDKSPAEIIVVGRLGASFGVHGWMHLKSFTLPPENLTSYTGWMLSPPSNSPKPKFANHQWQAISAPICKPHKQAFVAKFAEFDSPEAVQPWVGRFIGVALADLPKLDHVSEFYWRELIGCRVENVQGVHLGEVKELLETGVHDVLVIRPALDQSAGTSLEEKNSSKASKPDDLLIPFVDQYVIHVDLQQRCISVAWDSSWT